MFTHIDIVASLSYHRRDPLILKEQKTYQHSSFVLLSQAIVAHAPKFFSE